MSPPESVVAGDAEANGNGGPDSCHSSEDESMQFTAFRKAMHVRAEGNDRMAPSGSSREGREEDSPWLAECWGGGEDLGCCCSSAKLSRPASTPSDVGPVMELIASSTRWDVGQKLTSEPNSAYRPDPVVSSLRWDVGQKLTTEPKSTSPSDPVASSLRWDVGQKLTSEPKFAHRPDPVVSSLRWGELVSTGELAGELVSTVLSTNGGIGVNGPFHGGIWGEFDPKVLTEQYRAFFASIARWGLTVDMGRQMAGLPSIAHHSGERPRKRAIVLSIENP